MRSIEVKVIDRSLCGNVKESKRLGITDINVSKYIYGDQLYDIM